MNNICEMCSLCNSLHYDMIIIFPLKSKLRIVLSSSRNHWEILFYFASLRQARQTRVAHHIYFLSLISSLTIALIINLKYLFYNETFSSLFQHMQPIIMVSVRFLFIILKELRSNKKNVSKFLTSSTKLFKFSVILFQFKKLNFNFSTHFILSLNFKYLSKY